MKSVKLKSFSIPQEVVSSPIFKITAICVAIFPIFLLVPLLMQYAVNLPIGDQWDTPLAALFKAADGTLSFTDLIAQHNESRKFFPRLLFLGMAFITGWDIRYEFLVTFFVACIISYQIYHLSLITIRGSKYKRLVLLLLANLIIFSPVQSENWLWGIQLITFIPIACITAGLIVSYSNFGAKLKTLILVSLCTVSTYSYANGMLAWFIVFPSAILIARLSPKPESKTQKWLIVGGTIGCISNLVLYFHNYVKPTHHPSFLDSLVHPFDAISYVLIFLGTPLGVQQLATARIVGAVLTTLFVCILLYLIGHRKNRQLIYCSIPWVAIGIYSCASALITTAGRLGFGLGSAMSSRYTTFSLYLVVSLVYLLAIVTNEMVQDRYFQRTRKAHVISGLLLFLVASFFILHTFTSFPNAKIMALTHRQRLHAKACLLFVNFVDEKSIIEATIYPNYEVVKPKINRLNQIHLLKPALVESSNILALADKGVRYSPAAYGYLDSMTRINETEVSLSGWAVFPDREQPADAVVLAYEISTSEPKAFAIAAVMDKSPDIAKELKNQAYRNVRWHKTFKVDKLPTGSIKLSAWAFDTETRQTFRLANFKGLSGEFKLSYDRLRALSN